MADISSALFDEIRDTLENLTYGSVEIYVQDKKVTQITVRNIKKTNTLNKSNTNENKNGKYGDPNVKIGY